MCISVCSVMHVSVCLCAGKSVSSRLTNQSHPDTVTLSTLCSTFPSASSRPWRERTLLKRRNSHIYKLPLFRPGVLIFTVFFTGTRASAHTHSGCVTSSGEVFLCGLIIVQHLAVHKLTGLKDAATVFFFIGVQGD